MSTDRIFFPIGSCFEFNDLILRVEESETCQGCWFYNNKGVSCTPRSRFGIPDCGELSRQDGKDVRFVKVCKVNK